MEFEEQKLEHFKEKTRLPDFAVPKRYDLTLKLDLSGSIFSGIVLVDVAITQATRFLVLNALELVIHQVSFTNSQSQKYVPLDIVVDNEAEIVVLVFDEVLNVGNGVLEIRFSGVLNEHLKGFYRCTYMDGEEKKNMAATQFEAVDARMCFPCWDEPALKATFKITLDNIPSELTALSNMPVSKEKLDGHLKTVYFEESIVMSTYLVAVVVGLYEYIEDITYDGIKIRVYSPIGKSEKGKFALNIAMQTLDFFEKYFSMPYPLPKLDMVSVPEFSGGAMENYGLITCRETELIQDELYTAAANIQRLTIVVAHEVAHHWFGNLVTMEWWTHLWLNEGFATWVSYLVIDKLFPEWKIWNRFLQEMKSGLHMDALEQSHPIEVEIHQARSVLEFFDAISYEKGSSVIRMLQDYLGDEIFQMSLGSYMKRYAFANAKTEDLWNVLTEVSGVDVNTTMEIWTKQKGYPVISVELKDHILEFEQNQFLSSGLHSDSQWIVPMTLSLGSYNEQKKFLLQAKKEQLDIEEFSNSSDISSSRHDQHNQENFDNNWWIKVNVHQAGFYRVKYDDNLMARLKKATEGNYLSAEDEFGILDDAFALCEACEMPFSSLLCLMDVYRKELDYIVLSRLIYACYSAVKIVSDAIPDLMSELKQFCINLLLLSAEKLGWDATSGESQSNALMREEVLMALASFGHPQTHEEARKRFHAFLEGKNVSILPADTRKAAYTAILRNTSTDNRKGLDCLLKIYREIGAPQEEARVLRCIASSADPIIVSEVLNWMLSDEVRRQDVVYILSGISWEGRAIAWSWFKENWDQILKIWGSEMLLTHFVVDIVTPFCSNEMADEIEEFFATHPVQSIAMNLKQSLELIRIKARWIEYIKQEKESIIEVVKGLASKK
ncbi:Aminopeptidase M1 [Abeliophyllum distichum]|uniref:Aminopeptidase n=1 Tax=Abeliophyllum distichum TaxID=126358 RepID=A0ABD1S011_9LAMI